MAGANAVDPCIFRLPSVLTAKIWSADRVVMGRQVCKHLNENLLKHVRQILLQSRREVRSKDLPKDSCLMKYAGNVIDLKWEDGERASHLLRVLFSFRDEGFGGSLRSFSLRDADMHPSEMTGFADFLRTCTKIEDLDLSCIRMGGVELAEVASGLLGCTTLQSLDLRLNRMRSGPAQWIADALSECSGLTKLNIAENGLGDKGAKMFGEKLGNCVQLTHLDVSDNDFEGGGWKALADGLSACQSLRFLDLTNNFIGDDGARMLADLMTSCTALTHLSLVYVSMGASGCEHLARGLAHCTHLARLELRANGQCGDEGMHALLDALPRLRELTHLDLSGCNIESRGAATLSQMLAAHPPPRLTCLDLSENRMLEQDCTSLRAAVAPLLARAFHLDLIGNCRWGSWDEVARKGLEEGRSRWRT